MAQPGNFTPILLYGSSTPTNVPLAANLTNSATGSEIAINVADKNLFFKDSGGTVNTVPIRQSSTSSNGWLSSTDWNTFNNKAPAGAYLTAVTADSPLSGAGTSASHLVIAQANTSTSGYLSSTDWNTFNGKQATLVSGTNIKTVGGVTLLGSGDIGTIGVGYGGTGLTSLTTGYIPYGNGTSAFSSSVDLQFSGVTLGIGVTPSTWSLGRILQVGGTTALWNDGSGYTYFTNNTYYNGGFKYLTTAPATSYVAGAGQHFWSVAPSGTAGSTITFTQVMQMHGSGGVSIGNTTDPGATNLSVTGSTTSALFKTATNGPVSATNATFTTVYTFANVAQSRLYVVFTNIGSVGDSANYGRGSYVVTDGASATIYSEFGGLAMDIQMSGLNLQAAQVSGGTQNIYATVTRLA